MILTYIIIKLPNRTSEAYQCMLDYDVIPKDEWDVFQLDETSGSKIGNQTSRGKSQSTTHD